MNDHVPAPPDLAVGKYRHYKGKEYQVIGVALHSETLQPMVVYAPLYDSVSNYWVRPYDMFVEQVTVNGRQVPRFEPIDS